MRIALSIAASDPTGGAGLQADLRVFQHLGVHGAGVVTALTVQDSRQVHSVLPVFPSVVLAQLRTLLADLTPHAVKIGALASDDVVRSVRLGLEALAQPVPVVIDPILFASSGAALLERRAWGALLELMRGSALVTPNLPEAEALSGTDVSTRRGTEKAARFFVEDLGARAALVKGGHREAAQESVADLLAVAGEAGDVSFRWLETKRIASGPMHGTGCALSAAIAAALARGERLEAAVEAARAFVAAGIAASSPAGAGARFLVYP